MSYFKAQMHQIRFGWGYGYSAPPNPLARFKGPTSKGERGGRQGYGNGREG